MSETQDSDKMPKKNTSEDSEGELIESHCGIGSFQPRILQPCKSVLSFSIMNGFVALISSSLSVYIGSQITALEKQFHLDSTTTGIILSCNDIGFLSTVLIVAHFGSRHHIPRLLYGACVLYGISGIIAGLCYFLDPYYLPKLSSDVLTNVSKKEFLAPLCGHGNEIHENCGADSPGSGGPSWVIWLLGAGMVFQGIGKSPRSSLAVAYVDNNNPVKTKTGFYIGIMMTMAILGPAMSMVLGGIFRRIPVDLQETVLTPTHPKWIGAWWIGFLLFGGLGVVIGLPMVLFPKHIQPQRQDKDKEGRNAVLKIKSLLRALLRVVKSPVYSMVVVGLFFTMFIVSGSVQFEAKYVEKQFMVPGYKTNIILGIQKLVSVGVGTFTGGVLTSKLKMTRYGCLKMMVALVAVGVSVNIIMCFLGCETPEIYGYTEKYRSVVLDDGLDDCTCNMDVYFPVCGDRTTFYSPCFAGCTNQSQSMYGGCSRVTNGQVTSGMCDTDCPYLYYYIGLDSVERVVATMTIAPLFVTLLRSVDEKDKAMATGLMSFTMSLLGYIPAPIVFGYLIDTCCLVWNQTCGTRGSCGQYDLRSLRYKLKGLEAGARGISMFFYLAAFLYLRRKGKEDLHGDDKTKQENETIQMTKL